MTPEQIEEIEFGAFRPGDGTYDEPLTRAQHDETCGAGMMNWSDGSLSECASCRSVLHVFDSPSDEESYWTEMEEDA